MAATKSVASKEGTALAEQFFGQVSESIQLVFDLTSRIDERVKMLIERQKEIDDQIEKLLEMQQSVIHRLTHLEAKDIGSVQEDLHILSEKVAIIASDDPEEEIQDLKTKVHDLQIKVESINMRVGNHDTRWSKIFDYFWKFGLMLIAGYILYKLGIQAPPSP